MSSDGPTILIIDDEPEALEAAQVALLSWGIGNTLTCQDPGQALAMLEGNEVGVVLLDLVMPGYPGDRLLARIVEAFPDLPVVVMTGVSDTARVVRCMQAGAFDYLVKPVSGERLATTVKQASRWRELRQVNLRLRQGLLGDALQDPEAFEDFDTACPAMLSMFRYAEAIAPGPECMLITGETGVGKELMARAVHRLSGRSGPFVAVNMAGIDEAMFADTLFGHRRGGFTGASEGRPGMVRKAAGGTLLLDEIGDLDVVSQLKLLRLLQGGEYYPLGSDELSVSSARILASTCTDLAERVRAGAFRKDLYFRLKVHHVTVPPLRSRLETDLPRLVASFLDEAAAQTGRSKPRLPRGLMSLLMAHDFPGNVRELRAMIFDAVLQCEGGTLPLEGIRKQLAGGVSPEKDSPSQKGSLPDQSGFPDQLPTIAESTRALVQEALRRTGGNQAQAARILGISPQALSQRLKRMR